MEFILGLGATTIAIAVFIWLLPILLIARSNKTSGAEKLVWILYALVAPLAPQEGQS